jgi:diadenosine tetraphosphate (Ap4A) HIT family hydrolase
MHNQDNLKDYILSVVAKKKPISHLNLLQSDEWIDFMREYPELAKKVVNEFRLKVQ